jgi:hypothetical protein
MPPGADIRIEGVSEEELKRAFPDKGITFDRTMRDLSLLLLLHLNPLLNALRHPLLLLMRPGWYGSDCEPLSSLSQMPGEASCGKAGYCPDPLGEVSHGEVRLDIPTTGIGHAGELVCASHQVGNLLGQEGGS